MERLRVGDADVQLGSTCVFIRPVGEDRCVHLTPAEAATLGRKIAAWGEGELAKRSARRQRTKPPKPASLTIIEHASF